MSGLAIAAQAIKWAADDSSVSPGVLGFVVVGLLGVATWLLIKSMNRQFRKIDIPDEDDENAPTEDQSGSGSGDRGGSAQS